MGDIKDCMGPEALRLFNNPVFKHVAGKCPHRQECRDFGVVVPEECVYCDVFKASHRKHARSELIKCAAEVLRLKFNEKIENDERLNLLAVRIRDIANSL